MSRCAPTILLIALAVALLAGIGELLRMRFARGDVFPVYSSYRADPLGTRALYESLELMPGVRVQRWLRETEKLPATLRGTLVIAGMDVDAWRHFDKNAAAKLDALARGGARVVVAFTAGFEERELRRWRASGDSDNSSKYDAFAMPDVAARAVKKRKAGETGPDGKDDSENTGKAENPEKKKRTLVDAGAQWGAQVALRRIRPGKDDRPPSALRAESQPPAWPEKLEWLSELYFDTEKDTDWRTLYTRDGRAVLVERAIGSGSVVLASDSFFLSNEALQRARATPLLAWLVDSPGGGRVVIFDEYHLGMEEERGVAALARRYGLAGAAGAGALLAALWIWRRMALFVPPPPDEEEARTGCEPTAGLEALLRRSLPRAQVAHVCVAEWKKTASPSDIERVDKALAGLPKNAPPEKIHAAAREALRKR